MKNRFIRSTLRLAPLAAALSFAAVVPLHAQTAVPKTPIYGVTIDTIAHLNKTITSLQKLPYRPTVRVVFDPGMTAADYYPALVKLHQVAYVMGEILDSSEFPTDLASYKARTQNFVSGLNGLVDIWEIANEINGEWLRPHPSGSTATVNAEEAAIGQMVAAAHSIVKSVGGKTAITLYYNDDSKGTNCWEKPQDYWKTWPTSFLSATVRQQTDYVFFSYYPYKDCPNLKPSWNADFAALETIFPNARVGFGEIGTSSKSAPYSVQSNLITTYYPMVNSSTDPRFVGGFFWWNYAEQMVPYTTTYWTLLRNTIQPLKVPK